MIDEFLTGIAYHHSSFSFVNIFIWSDFFDFRFEIINDYLCVFATHELGCFLYLPPFKKYAEGKFFARKKMGKNFLLTVEECFKIMRKENRSPSVSRIENVTLRESELFGVDQFSFFQKSYEYCYFKEDLINLKGNALKSKRGAFNHFVKSYPCEFLPFSQEMILECLSLYDQWSKNRLERSTDEVYNHMIQENRSVHEKAMRYYRDLGLIGRVVLVKGKIVGYSFGFPLNSQTFCILFEITQLGFFGLSVFLFSKFCEDPQLEGYEFINAMDDFGMKNMEAAKMSFRPSVLLPSYVITAL